MELHLLITLVTSSEYFRFIESLRTCIMASQQKLLLEKKKQNPLLKLQIFVSQENRT